MDKINLSSRSFGIPRFFFYLGLLTIGQTVIRPALSFTLSDWFFLISFLFTTSECLLRKKLEIKFPPYMILGLFLFTIGGIISSGYAKMPFESVLALIKYLYLIAAWFWLGTVLLQTTIQIKTSIVLWTSSAAMSGLAALIQVIWIDIIPGTSPAWSRMTGLTEHVNDLGGLTSISLIPAIMLMTNCYNNIWLLSHAWICAILIAAGLLLSVSMSGISALIVSILVWFILSRFSLKNILISIIPVVLFYAAITAQIHYDRLSFVSRFVDISDDGFSSITLQTRVDTYASAWEVIKENPLLGVGLGPDVSLTQTGHAVHNIFLLNWFQSGLFGLLGILLILGVIAFQAAKGMMDPQRKNERVLGIALFSSYIAFLVLGVAQPIFYNRFGWISAALLLSLYPGRIKLYYRRRPYLYQNKWQALVDDAIYK